MVARVGLSIALGIGLALLPGAEVRAINAVGLASWDGGVAEAQIDPGESATASGAGLAGSMAGNPSLNGSAWAHTGAWWSFYASDTIELRIRVAAANASELAPGVSVWAIGPAAAFDRGTEGFGSETSTAGFGTPHSFNAFGPLGNAGTRWMQQGQGGNAKQLLGYAIAGPSFLGTTGWGETIAHGAHDMSPNDDYVAGVSGLVGPGFAELVLTTVKAGWFALYVGGTDPSLVSGGAFTLTATSVPEPGTATLLLLGLGWLARRTRAPGEAQPGR